MANVFISHDSDDRQSAEEVRRWLVAEKHRVFLDQHPGQCAVRCTFW